MANTAPTDPARWLAAPLNAAGDGPADMVGEDEFPLMLLTIKDGHGAVADGA